ncbi:hypothetical protein Ancab_006424 [Ancistrocladus abbreviatus]
MAEELAQPLPLVKWEPPQRPQQQVEQPAIQHQEQPQQPEIQQQQQPKLSIPEPSLTYKNRLQEYTQRASLPLPVYQTSNEGLVHAPRFKSAVLVDGETYTSPNAFFQRKAAEQDAAKYALEGINKRMRNEGCALIREDTLFCKAILNEFAVKMNLARPTFSTKQSEGPLCMFTASVDFNGVKYTGEVGRNKKEAEQLAARAVLLSILGNSSSGTSLFEIIKSKAKLYSAVNKLRDSHSATITVPMEANSGNGNGTSASKEKEYDDANGAGHMLQTAVSEAFCEQVLNHPIMHHSLHEYVKLKAESASEASALPITFVPAVENQPPPADLLSGKKRSRKSKKKANKKVRNATQQPHSTRSNFSIQSMRRTQHLSMKLGCFTHEGIGS